jgi:hypothetical protein
MGESKSKPAMHWPRRMIMKILQATRRSIDVINYIVTSILYHSFYSLKVKRHAALSIRDAAISQGG